MRESEVRVAGVRSPTLEAGPEDAREAAVFVHGNPGSTKDWWALVRRAGEHGRAIALDMPGFGQADKPEHFTYTVEGYARHLAGALAELGVDRAHLVLHDFGGPWGLRWAADHPQAFASVTLVNAGVLIDYTWHAFAKIWRTPVLGELFFRTTTRPVLGLSLKRGQPVPLRPERLDEIYAATKDPGTQRAVLRLYRSTPAKAMGELRDVLRPLDRPALVVWGTRPTPSPARWSPSSPSGSAPPARLPGREGVLVSALSGSASQVRQSREPGPGSRPRDRMAGATSHDHAGGPG